MSTGVPYVRGISRPRSRGSTILEPQPPPLSEGETRRHPVTFRGRGDWWFMNGNRLNHRKEGNKMLILGKYNVSTFLPIPVIGNFTLRIVVYNLSLLNHLNRKSRN